MPHAINVSDVRGSVDVDGDTPPLWVLRDVLGMTGTKFRSGMALCRVHGASDGNPIWSCVKPADSIPSSVITATRQSQGPRRTEDSGGLAQSRAATQ
jgi:isoquinoline 1-oxidoreductase alpha subunit